MLAFNDEFSHQAQSTAFHKPLLRWLEMLLRASRTVRYAQGRVSQTTSTVTALPSLRTVRYTSQDATSSKPPLAMFDDDRIRVAEDYNRWGQLAPILTAGVAIGFYALPAAALGPSLCKVQGVVAQASTDFTMSALVPTTTLMPLTAGILASLLASRCEDMGVRRLALLACTAYPAGVFVIPGIAAHYNSFPVFAASYVALGGFGFFCAYPQQAPHALRWFPDRKGLAVSLFNVSFGFGLLMGVPIVQKLVGYFKRAPTRLGSFDEVEMVSSGANGARMALVDGSAQEVVLATQRDLDLSGFAQLSEGVFLLDGSNGAAETLVCVGALGSVILQFAAMTYRLPAKGFVPGPAEEAPAAKAATGPSVGTAAATATGADAPNAAAVEMSKGGMALEQAMRTPHLYLLALSTMGISMTGLPFLMNGKFMINDIFGGSLGASAAAASAAAFPALLSAANTSGRLAWGPVSDRIGSARTLAIFGVSVPSILMCPAAASLSAADPATAHMLFHAGAAATLVVFAGGPVMIAPAAAEVFGRDLASLVYRRLWVMVPLSNVVGTTLMSITRDMSYKSHCVRLADLCDDQAFTAAFGSGKADVASLVEAKAVTIPLLLKLLPADTPDPSPLLYNDVFYVLAGCSGAALAANLLLFRLPLKVPLAR